MRSEQQAEFPRTSEQSSMRRSDSKRVSTSARSSERRSRAPVLSQSSIRDREHQRPEQQAEVESTSARSSNGYREHKRRWRTPALRQQAREYKGKQDKNARETNDLKHYLMDAQLKIILRILFPNQQLEQAMTFPYTLIRNNSSFLRASHSSRSGFLGNDLALALYLVLALDVAFANDLRSKAASRKRFLSEWWKRSGN